MEKNHYDSSMKSFAAIDNNLAAASLAIGESSNLAQIALSYTYNFTDKKYSNYVCILSVIAQIAIDNAKRRYDVDTPSEIKRIKRDMNIEEYGYPSFWKNIKKEFNSKNVNGELKCPMNYLNDIKIKEFKPSSSTLPIGDFFVKHEFDVNLKRRSKKVEELIEFYSIDLFNYNTSYGDDEDGEYFVLRADFDSLIEDIKSIYISKNYIALMSWLINRAFCITKGVRSKKNSMDSTTETNKAILLKTLYNVNKEAFLKCFKEI